MIVRKASGISSEGCNWLFTLCHLRKWSKVIRDEIGVKINRARCTHISRETRSRTGYKGHGYRGLIRRLNWIFIRIGERADRAIFTGETEFIMRSSQICFPFVDTDRCDTGCNAWIVERLRDASQMPGDIKGWKRSARNDPATNRDERMNERFRQLVKIEWRYSAGLTNIAPSPSFVPKNITENNGMEMFARRIFSCTNVTSVGLYHIFLLVTALWCLP